MKDFERVERAMTRYESEKKDSRMRVFRQSGKIRKGNEEKLAKRVKGEG